MATQEKRIASLERKVAVLEVCDVHNEDLTLLHPGRNLREINENMTLLSDVIGKQGLAMGGSEGGHNATF